MKKILLLTVSLFMAYLSFGQIPPNFYTIKATQDAYYDSLIIINGLDSMQGTGYNPYMRWVDYWEPLVYPSGDFTPERQKLEQYVAKFIAKSPQSIINFDLNWESIGPNSMPEGSYISKPSSKGIGQIHYIAFDPNDATNQKMLACSPAGGLWRSTNGGDLWVNAGTDKGLPLCGVSSVAIDPENSETNWFVSTGDAEPISGTGWSHNAVGVGRTTDGGNTWEIIGLENVYQMRKIVLKRYNNTVHLFVATTSGLYECTDGLATSPVFTKIVDGNFYDIEFDLQTTGVLYASGTGENMPIYKVNWVNNIYTVLPNTGTISQVIGRRITIENSPAAPNKLFIVAADYETAFLYKYDLTTEIMINKGELSKCSSGSNLDPWVAGILNTRAMGWTISPNLNSSNDLTMVYGNTAPLYQSDNLLDDLTTCSWSLVTAPGYFDCNIHVDQHHLVYTNDGTELWAGNDGGVYKTLANDIINNWEEKCNGLSVATIQHLAISEKNKDIALSGQYDNGGYIYTNNGNEWNARHVSRGDGFQCQISWENPDTMWTSQQYNIWKNFNGPSGTFQNIVSHSHWHTFFVQNPEFPNIIYGNGYGNMEISPNYGAYYLNSYPYPGAAANSGTWRIAIAPTNGNYIYCGYHDPGIHKIFKSIVSTPSSSSDWEDIGSPPINDWISSIAVDYYNPDHIWVSCSDKVYDVNTLTQTWTEMTNGLPSYISGINHLEVYPGKPGAMYAGTNYGLYYYEPDLGEWQFAGEDLPNLSVRDIQIDMTNHRISVGTFGRGVWVADIPCETASETMEINENTTWEDNMWVSKHITVKSGYTLTVKGKLYMFSDAQINVEPGAELDVDGGTITSACRDMWKGIVVLGDESKAQTTQYQGKAYIHNGAVIENAKYAVTNVYGHGGGVLIPSGGIIYAIDAIFRNNSTDFELNDYYSINSIGTEINNLSYCKKSTFETTDDALNSNYYSHVNLDDVNGVQILGNVFEEKRTGFDVLQNGRTGISSSSASFKVDVACANRPPLPCGEIRNEFINLKYGIQAYGLNNPADFSIEIKSADFNCPYGTYLMDIENAEIHSNNFTQQTYHNNFMLPITYGLYLDFCENYDVEGNDFTGVDATPSYYVAGLVVKNQHSQNTSVYRNTFNNLGIGTEAVGQNKHSFFDTGLRILCNEYENGLTDILVKDDVNNSVPVTYRGIALNQGINEGATDELAGNLFGDNSNKHINNSNCATFNYYHHHPTSGPTPELRVVPTINLGTLNIIPQNIDYGSSSCPDNLDTGGGLLPLGIKSLAVEQLVIIEDTKVELETLVDGGNTTELKQEVIFANEIDAYDKYNDLMNKEGYLSEEVLEEVAAKETALNKAMVRDVLMANPHAAKSAKVQEKLNTRLDQLPDYMRAQIQEGLTAMSAKEYLELRKAKAKASHDYLINRGVRALLKDSLDRTEDILGMLSNTGDIAFEYRKLAILDAKNRSTEAQQVLALMQSMEISEKQAENLQDFTNIRNLLNNWKQEGKSMIALAEADINTLKTYGSKNNKAAAKAMVILQANGKLDYVEPVYRPEDDNNRSAQQTWSSFGTPTIEKDMLKLYPNPAKDYFTIEYSFTTNDKPIVLKVSDVQGKVVYTKILQYKHDQIVIDATDYTKGTYYISLFAGSKLIKSKSIQINK